MGHFGLSQCGRISFLVNSDFHSTEQQATHAHHAWTTQRPFSSSNNSTPTHNCLSYFISSPAPPCSTSSSPMEKKITDEMESDEWDLLSDDGFVDVHQREIVERGEFITTSPRGVFDMNYFSCRSPTSFDEEIVKEVIKVGDQDMISSPHVSLEKETEFVDMNMDSPKSGKKGVVSFIDTKEDSKEEEKEEKKCLGERKSDDGVNMWGWKLTGIGALCSIGMAAASVCIFILGRSHKKQQHHVQNQKLRFQIYTDDKRFKQVVHHASKLNQVVSSVRGGPLNRAQFTLGGYYVYDGI